MKTLTQISSDLGHLKTGDTIQSEYTKFKYKVLQIGVDCVILASENGKYEFLRTIDSLIQERFIILN